MNWAKQHTQHLSKVGFQKGRASACSFVRKSTNIGLTSHVDDFIVVARGEEIGWLVKENEKKGRMNSSVP